MVSRADCALPSDKSFFSQKIVAVTTMNRRKLKLDMTHSASDGESKEVENYVNNVKEQIMNATELNSDYVWQECYDDVSGFIYYWNTQTNKVTWEKPEHYEAAHSIDNQDVVNKTKNSRKRLSSDSLPTLDPNSCNGSKKSKLESKVLSALVAYGSDSSEDENEDDKDQKTTILQRLQQKAEMFKQKELAKLSKAKSPDLCETNGQPDILDIIDKEVPPDYLVEKSNKSKSSEKKTTGDIFDILKSEVPPDYVDVTLNNNTGEENKLVPLDINAISKLHSKTVENDSNSKYHSNTDEKLNNFTSDSLKENSLKSINLIANYGEEDLEDLDDQKSESNEKTLSYVQDPCANIKIGFGYSVSSKHKNGGSINFVKGETINVHDNHNSNKNNVFSKHEKETIKNCDMKKSKIHIEDLSLLISSKLHFLSDCENNEKLSTVQVMTIKIDTLMEAWKDNCLNDEYFSKWLDEMAIELCTLEESVAPDGWTCQWDKINTRYYYQNDVDGRTQWQYPTEESERTPSPPMISNASTPPPPNISDHNSCHPEPVDMDIDEDNHKEDTEIIVPPVPGDELSYELNSFYADLAQFESKPAGQIETMIAVPSPEIVETAPKLKTPIDTLKNTQEEEKEIIKPKKKKKVGKLDVGLGLKQKYVSSLVQKWQQIQNEIK
ncbi:formin-binding protein 4-like [Metopolophium dirhodum]|uniref:formin-binding protein 4-like n=1 Tax=Metopolophium dirhodum TaxID=44670 RepID=UPI0029901890|nr:formin-binding protein 4-like [Metopolophium dirhodum]